MPVSRLVAPTLLLVALTASACGGSGAERVSAEDPSSATAADAASASGDDVPTSTAPLFSSDFDAVCAGAAQPRAAAYQPGEPGPHPVILLQGASGHLSERTVDLPDHWRIDWQPDQDALTGIELVACSVATPGAAIRECTGYEDQDGNATAQTVQLRSATYDVTLRAAATGDVVATTTVTAADDTCPLVVSSDATEDLATDDMAVVAFLAPHVEG